MFLCQLESCDRVKISTQVLRVNGKLNLRFFPGQFKPISKRKGKGRPRSGGQGDDHVWHKDGIKADDHAFKDYEMGPAYTMMSTFLALVLNPPPPVAKSRDSSVRARSFYLSFDNIKTSMSASSANQQPSIRTARDQISNQPCTAPTILSRQDSAETGSKERGMPKARPPPLDTQPTKSVSTSKKGEGGSEDKRRNAPPKVSFSFCSEFL